MTAWGCGNSHRTKYVSTTGLYAAAHPHSPGAMNLGNVIFKYTQTIISSEVFA